MQLFVSSSGIRAILLFQVVLFTLASTAQVKRLYIANDDHTDYMWTADEAKYDTAFVQMLDYYLDQIDVTKSNPDDYQARFNCDGGYWLTVYEKYRTPQQFKRLVAAIKSGHISSPLTALANTYGAQPTEAVIRGMYAAGKMERKLGIRFRMAVAMENQTLPLGLSSLWAGSGARYSWKGVCACATRITKSNFRSRRHQLYNYTGLDGSKVIMKWNNLGINNTYMGGYAEARGGVKPKDTLEGIKTMIRYLDTLCSPGNTYAHLAAGAFGYGWDDLATFVSPFFIEAARSMTTATRKIRVSNEEDFFKDIEKNYPILPSESVSYGNEWDTYSVSLNETTAKVRRATEQLRNAEALASVIGLKNKTFYKKMADARNGAWEGYGLYWEHDWTADGPVSQKDRADWQVKIQERISAYSDSLLTNGISELGSQLKKAANPRFYVFNALSWTRNDVADIPYTGKYPCDIVDLATNKPVTSQLIYKSGKPFIRILAENIPSVGYKVFEIRTGQGRTGLPDAATLEGYYLTNNYYRIKINGAGVLTEIYDRAANRQLVKAVKGTFVNDLGVTEKNPGSPVTIEDTGPVSVTVKAVAQYPVPHTVRVTLFSNQPRIDIEDSIQANFTELQTWSFSFNLDKPTTRHEELGSVLTVKTETNGGHYAAQNARYDWQTFNHFADLSEDNYGVTLSNEDCSFFRLGNSKPDSLDETASQIHALAGGQTDRYVVTPAGRKDTTRLGIASQNGQTDFKYRFSLTTHSKAFDPVDAMKFSLVHQNPLVTGMVTGSAAARDVKTFSLLNISDPGVLLWSVKPSDDAGASSLTTRFWNMKDKKTQPLVALQTGIGKAWITSHLETIESEVKPSNGKLTMSFAPFQIKTYQLLAGPDK